MPEVGAEPLSNLLKQASGQNEDSDLDPLFKGAESEADKPLVKQASEIAQKGRDLARERVAEIAAERKKIAEELGKDSLEDLDKMADLNQVGRQLAQQFVQTKVAETQHQQKIAAQYDQIEEEYGEEVADDLAKFAFYDQVGRNLAATAVAEALQSDE